MKKTLILAATLSLAAGAAFADSHVPAHPTQASNTPAATSPIGDNQPLLAETRGQVHIYSMFPAPGNTQEAAR